MNNKKIGILTSGGDCGGLNAAIRSIFYRAKNKYNMDVFGIKDGTAGFMKRPVSAIQLTHKTFEGYLLRQGGTFLGSTNKGNPFKFPTTNGKFLNSKRCQMDFKKTTNNIIKYGKKLRKNTQFSNTLFSISNHILNKKIIDDYISFKLLYQEGFIPPHINQSRCSQ